MPSRRSRPRRSRCEGRFHEFKSIGSVIGTGASAFFLLAIAGINLVILRGVWRSFRRARRGEPVAEHELNLLLSGRGFLARIFRPLFRMVSRSWQMFPIGFLFGLGFDTATEISLFTVAASQASGGMTFGTIMMFPALFTAGMTLVDTTDSVLMVGAYGWAFLNPIRKIWYNLTITAISVVVALLIGGIEALGLIADKLGLEGAFWDTIGDLNGGLANFGYLVVGIFIASWAISYLHLPLAGPRPAAGRARLGGCDDNLRREALRPKRRRSADARSFMCASPAGPSASPTARCGPARSSPRRPRRRPPEPKSRSARCAASPIARAARAPRCAATARGPTCSAASM